MNNKIHQFLGLPGFVAFALSASLMLSACEPQSGDNASTAVESNNIPFREDGKLTISRDEMAYATIAIEIADTDSTRTRGMMQRISTPENSGMLFIFDYEEDREFWMANTPLSLDLIFADADSTIITIKKYMQPFSPQEVPSEGPARFVLEVVAGYSDTIGILEGDKLSWEQ